MKTKSVILGILLWTGIVYFAYATRFQLRPLWALDYFNLLAAALREGHINILNPPYTYDLLYYRAKWYAPWGVLVALFLLPVQLIKGRFVPPVYLSIVCGSINVVLLYCILLRVRDGIFSGLSRATIALATILYAFGSMNFYVATLGSAWHVDQMVTNIFGTLSVYFIFKKNRRVRDYMFSVAALVPAFLGHATQVLFVSIPATLYVWDILQERRKASRTAMLWRGMFIFGIPMLIGTVLFFAYNFLRFGNVFEYGYQYIHEAPELASRRLSGGIMSLSHIPFNFRYFAFELPRLYWNNGLRMGINVYGNSLFFLTPPLVYIFLASPFRRRRHAWHIDPYVLSLWIGAIVTFLPSLAIYSTGWMQFGYRYALDIMVPLVLLTVFGIRGRPLVWYGIGVALAVLFHTIGIQVLW